ncbi:hypothetical protein [Paraprevotella xylaniphila]|uniref:Uncharacterized protein n=1 Tax=Siphoviridae sp. ctr8v12 TaxID=2825685 RepID=A0A8S5QFF0_9CAUD|nr:hypothetical protein [Paraprevotella xylaniphila]DAE18006.1 MAG TPA: hypothetical protein [Siphoviridae sp. ctr8v12]
MKQIIPIPNVPRDDRIGSVFNHLFKVIYATRLSHDDVVWDFSDTTFFHPFFLAPFAIYKSLCGKNIECRNMPSYLSSYLDSIYFHTFLDIKDDSDLQKSLQSYSEKSYIPICRFSLKNKNIDRMQSLVQATIEKQNKLDSSLKSAISYMLSELICNISEHSESEFGYLYSQRKGDALNICIADAGVTVYGSYLRAKKYLEKISGNEAEALRIANEGFSTKDLPNAENRGFGLSTTKRMIVDGLGGSFFMLSGGAFHRHNKDGIQYIKLPEYISWDGTVLLIRIPLTVPSDFNYYKYIIY